MGCCDTLGKTVLVIINIIFSLVGVAFLTIGCVVRYGSDLLDTYLQDAYNKFDSALKSAGADVSLGNMSIGELLEGTTLAFIIIGVFFFLLGIVGCFGACCKVKALLTGYAIVLILVFLVELVFVILLFTIRPTIDSWLQDPLVSTLKKDYNGTNGTDSFTLAINFVMHEFKCCGILNYSDFANATKWKRPNGVVVPKVCCKDLSDESCTKNPTANNSYTDKGCYQAVSDSLTENSSTLIGVGSGLAAVQLILIVLTFVVCCKSREKDDDIDTYRDNIPIQPYNESKDAEGYNNVAYYPDQRPDYRSEVRGQSNSRAPYEDRYAPEPYQGRTDYYREPPEGYRGGHRGYR